MQLIIFMNDEQKVAVKVSAIASNGIIFEKFQFIGV